jgi:hypothetical protein
MLQILAILFNLVLLIYYTIKSYTNHQTAFKIKAGTSMITKLLLTLHLLGHLVAWITIRHFLNECTYISIGISILICLFTIELGNNKRQIWVEVHSSSRPDNLNLNYLLASWITPASFLTIISSKIVFRRNVSTLERKILIVFTFMASALLQLVHLSLIALLLNIADVFELSTNSTVARYILI